MKLAVVCSSSRLEQLPGLRDVLDGLYVEYLAWHPDADHGSDAPLDSLERCLDFSSYVLCLSTATDVDETWVHYVLGHQRGRTDRLTFWFRPEDAAAIPRWLDRFVVIVGDEGDVYDYYAEVEQTWSEEARAHIARKAITELNLEVSARSFIESVRSGDRFLMGLFLESGFSPSLRDASGVPVLSHAVREGHDELVPPLLDAGADINGVAADRGTTPLMDAASGGHDALTRLFLDRGADLEHASRDGQTAVTLAVGNGRDLSAEALIRAGANVDTTDMLGMSARKYATLYKQKEILESIEAVERTTPLSVSDPD